MTQSERIATRIAASQARLNRDIPALPAPIPPRDAYPPEDYRTLAAEYPWLAMAAGLGVGLLAGSLIPKRAGGKFGKRAVALAMMAGEIGLALSKEAGEKASGAGREGLARTKDGASQLRATARSTGASLAREAIRLAARARR
ncbi:MAG: hypothetical protein O9272_12570 [Brevundimonas sp.]|nr:hypothetical protein [Brevundimonas sp.]MCZ8323547.1 hypothetical protein [Novosphingobium sp.]